MKLNGAFAAAVLSIVASVLEAEPSSRVTLLLGNRDAASTMFADELSMLVARAEAKTERGRPAQPAYWTPATATSRHRSAPAHHPFPKPARLPGEAGRRPP